MTNLEDILGAYVDVLEDLGIFFTRRFLGIMITYEYEFYRKRLSFMVPRGSGCLCPRLIHSGQGLNVGKSDNFDVP